MSDDVCTAISCVSRETRDRLSLLLRLVRRWGATVNLVSAADLEHLEHRHLDDCLQLFPLAAWPVGTRAIDLGSGAGFPGIVLAIVTGVRFDLVESDQRKAAFLREAARQTDAPIVVHAIRAESASLTPAPILTARALAPLDRLLGWAAPLLSAGGVALFPKGAHWRDELTHARRCWHMRADAVPSRTNADSVVLRITELSPVVDPG